MKPNPLGIFGWFKGFALAVVLCGAWACAPSPQSEHERLERALTAKLESLQALYGFPGATASVVLPDGTVIAVAAGLADVEEKIPMRADHKMQAGSIGKTFVAALLVKLHNDGRLDLDDQIEKWFGERPWFSHLPNGRDITIRMLLNHSSGLENHAWYPKVIESTGATFDPERSYRPSHEELVTMVLDKPPLFPAGEGFAYSDTNYILAGWIIELVAGENYYAVLQSEILDPLGLEHTVPLVGRDIPSLAVGYMGADNEFAEFGFPDRIADIGRLYYDPTFEWTGGGLASTSADLAKWGWSLYSGAAFDVPYVEQILNVDDSRAPITDVPSIGPYRYGLAVYVHDSPLGTLYGHGGVMFGYTSRMRYAADHGFAVAVQVNRLFDSYTQDYIEELGKITLRHLECAQTRDGICAGQEGGGNNVKKILTAVLAALSWGNASAIAQDIEVRVAPSDVIYTNENNRRIGIYDIMVQTISVINNSDEPVTLEDVVIEALEEGDVILTDRLLAENYLEVWNAFYPYFSNPETQKSDDTLVLFSQTLPEGVSVSPTLMLEPGTAILVRNRLLALSGYILPDTVRVRAKLVDASGKSIAAETSLPVVKYEAKNEFIFPLKGRWYLSSSSSIRSHHRARPAHEFALDLMRIGDGGKSFRTDGSSPEDYYAFGEDVLAIADGTVIAAEKDIPETEMPKPGEARNDFAQRVLGAMWEKDPTGRIAGGNYVVIEHPGKEYSVYVHMRHNSVTVTPGDKVKQGQVIGQLGISGDGFEPHLHFSVTDTADMNYGHGLPVKFTNVNPVGFSSTLDMSASRLFLSGEFVDAGDPAPDK